MWEQAGNGLLCPDPMTIHIFCYFMILTTWKTGPCPWEHTQYGCVFSSAPLLAHAKHANAPDMGAFMFGLESVCFLLLFTLILTNWMQGFADDRQKTSPSGWFFCLSSFYTCHAREHIRSRCVLSSTYSCTRQANTPISGAFLVRHQYCMFFILILTTSLQGFVDDGQKTSLQVRFSARCCSAHAIHENTARLGVCSSASCII